VGNSYHPAADCGIPTCSIVHGGSYLEHSEGERNNGGKQHKYEERAHNCQQKPEADQVAAAAFRSLLSLIGGDGLAGLLQAPNQRLALDGLDQSFVSLPSLRHPMSVYRNHDLRWRLCLPLQPQHLASGTHNNVRTTHEPLQTPLDDQPQRERWAMASEPTLTIGSHFEQDALLLTYHTLLYPVFLCGMAPRWRLSSCIADVSMACSNEFLKDCAVGVLVVPR
jgi:hypothetical protein